MTTNPDGKDGGFMGGAHSRRQRIVVVSNRLPFTVVPENGEMIFKESVGGLATGLSGTLGSLQTASSPELEYLWVGWPGGLSRGGIAQVVRL